MIEFYFGHMGYFGSIVTVYALGYAWTSAAKGR